MQKSISLEIYNVFCDASLKIKAEPTELFYFSMLSAWR